jgi:hypothetical protein
MGSRLTRLPVNFLAGRWLVVELLATLATSLPDNRAVVT